MTEYQELAKNYLDQYRQGVTDLKRLENRVQLLRDRANGIRSALDIQEGWTGALDGRGNKIMVPISVSKSPDVQSKVLLLDAVVFQSVEYDNKAIELINLCTEMENLIDKHLGLCVEGTILKYRYIDLFSYEQIAVNVCYSYSHVKRLHWNALEVLGQKMSRDEPLDSGNIVM